MTDDELNEALAHAIDLVDGDYDINEVMAHGLALFLQGDQTEVKAVNLIQVYVEKKVPIPVELLQYVGDMITPWKKVEGKRNIRKDTKGRWRTLTWIAHLHYRLIGDKEEALALVTAHFPYDSEGNEYDHDTLQRHYNMADSQPIKDEVDQLFESVFGVTKGKLKT